MPLVTVITPTYNVASYVGEAADSVFRQTFADFEYLVIDDGSDDDTVRVVTDRGHADLRFRVVRAGHRGVSAARNLGIKEAKGDYIAFLDGDDKWHPRFLERQVALIKSLPDDVGAVFCRSRMTLENGTLIGVQWQRAGRYDFDDLLIGNNPARNGSSLLIRRSCFDEVGDFDETMSIGEDFEMWLRIAHGSRTPIFWGNKHLLADLRLRPGSAMRDRSAAYIATRQLLTEQTPKLKRSPTGLAYVHLAAAALKYGDAGEDLAEELASQARSAGIYRLASSITGCRLLFWSTLPRPARKMVRTAQHGAREAVKSANRRVRGSSSTPYPGSRAQPSE
jgi:glycosyltransferase involved in cell wall biosynthesis